MDEVEAHSREVCGYSEIDYERNKAAWLKEQPPAKLDPEGVLPQLDQFETEARSRGVTHTTFRRLTECLGYGGTERNEIQRILLETRTVTESFPCGQSKVETSSYSNICATTADDEIPTPAISHTKAAMRQSACL
ncbi:hypothetical protein [Streptomyces sp. DSM 40750]|uniref:hypothetical protein n=1 Tax=Streptomyces sp. DSM 40750 TaxID=2801030 RepID=UPI003FA7B96D